jgi:serine/threonine protein kinase/tetratricopeptide (TPR) repeat protein
MLPNRYRIIGELARGGMGIVYHAFDRVRDSDVAVKMLVANPGQELLAYLRFDREARNASSIAHPNVCRVHEIDSMRGHPYIVMELLDGETLKQRLSTGPCDTRAALDLVQQVTSGLAAVHALDIIHRDIKPANVFITACGVVKLLDFGLAKHFAVVDALHNGHTDITVTETGYAPGTVHYMSPEQLLGQRLDQRTDLFSLGVLLYEMLTGRQPFTGTTPAEAIARTLHAGWTRLGSIPFAAEWERILEQLLAKRPEHRYHDAVAVLDDLDRLAAAVRGEPVAWPARAVRTGTPPPVSLAIVPFRAVHRRSHTDEDKSGADVFCHALLEAVTIGLSRLDGLHLVARTLTSRVTRRSKALETVGRQLFTNRILTGAIERIEGRFLVAASLFDVPTGTAIWTGEFNVAPEELFHLRDEIVRSIAGTLGVIDVSGPRPTASKARNREAFELCLKGSVFWSRRYEGGLLKALECFRAALALEPDSPLAHAGLADTYSFLGFYSLLLPRTAWESARKHALEAQRLDPGLAQAHTSLGLVKLGADWNWEEAKAEFREAVRLDATQALAHIYLSWTLALDGRKDEAYEQARLAQDCDPTSPLLNAGAGYTFFHSRSFDRGIAECEKALEIDDTFLVARYVMALCKGEQAARMREQGHTAVAAKLYGEAIQHLEYASERSGRMVFYVGLLGKMYADTGERRNIAKAKKILEEFDTMRAAGRYVPPHAWVYVYAGLRDLDRAFDWQKKAVEDSASPFYYLSPQLGILHRDPRFLQYVGGSRSNVTRWLKTTNPVAVVPAGSPRPR